MTNSPDHLDLRDRLDRAIGAAPPAGPSTDPRLLGRRAVRRRRATLVAAAAAVALVGGGVATLTLGGDTDSAVQVAVEPPAPSTAPTPGAAPSTPPRVIPTTRPTDIPVPDTDPAAIAQTRLSDDHWADFRDDGSLELLPDATVVEQIDDPVKTDVQSIALELARPGKTNEWYLVEFIPGSYPVPSSTSIPARSGGFDTLQAWIDVIGQPVEPLDQGYGDAVTRATDGTLSPGRGVRILEQRSGVDVGERFAPAADTSAALVARDGQRLFVLARTLDGTTDIIEVPQPLAGAKDLDGFISFAVKKYASGVGLR